MIRKSTIIFDAHTHETGSKEVRFTGEDLLHENDPIKVISSLYCRLPFRLRLGLRTVFDIGGITPARITVINSVGIPNAPSQQPLTDLELRKKPAIASNVLITLSPKKLDEDQKVTILKALYRPNYSEGTPLYVNPEDPLTPLNSLLVSYLTVLGDKVSGNRIRRMFRKDISRGHTYELHVFKRRHDNNSLQQIEKAIEGAAPSSPIPFFMGGAIQDVSEEDIVKLRDNLKQTVRYAFYSFAVQAQDYIQQTDYLNALLYSVIAFENAHAEFIEHISETRANCTDARRWSQELLRQAGISAFVELTPSLFMSSKDRPPETTISGVVRAINIRNELAHAKRDKNGNLKVNQHRSSDLLPLINDVLDYINTIARQLPDWKK